MDRITHQVRLANWTKIIEQCNNRPAEQLQSSGSATTESVTKVITIGYVSWDKKLTLVQKRNFLLLRPSREQQPAVTFAEIPLPNQQNSMTDTFKADAVIHTGTMVIGISNTISDTLLSRLLEVAHHACWSSWCEKDYHCLWLILRVFLSSSFLDILIFTHFFAKKMRITIFYVIMESH